MKKIFMTISALALALVLVLGLGATAYAESSVSYQGGAEKFVFLDGSEYTDTDLFAGFKGVMPGDEISQVITVRNNFTGVDNVKIYLRAVLHDEEGNPLSENVAAETDLMTMQDFLSALSMTVKQGDKLLFSASPDELGGLKDNVLLGTFSGKSHTTLTVTLSVPIELGNEYMDSIGEVDWVFTAEEIKNTDAPKTGDESGLALWASLAALSVLAMGAVLVVGRKKSGGK